jgi:hypothetical protein
VGVGSAAVVQQITWEEALRAGRVLFGSGADALLAGSAWRDELKRAYKRRVLETHPDRARALGRAEGELAREFQAVADAYRLLQEAPDARHWLRPRPTPRPAPRPAWRPPPRAADPDVAASRARREAEARRAERARRAEEARRQEEDRRAQARYREEAGRRQAEALRAEAAVREAATRRASAGAKAKAETAPRGGRSRGAPAADWRHVAKPRPMPRRRIRLAEFLYYSGRISWAVMVEAIAWQRRQRPAVGRIAVEYGFLTPLEVMQVIERRFRAGACDVPFGEFALRIGLITPFERLAMVGRQTRLQRPIGQYFVERGVIGEEEIEGLRREIVRHNLRHYV